MENTYCIIKTEDISKCNFDLLITNDPNVLNKNNDGTKCIIEWETKPAFIDDIDIVGIYTHKEILEILSTNEWAIDTLNINE